MEPLVHPVLLELMKLMATAYWHLQDSILLVEVTPSLLYYAALREQQLAGAHLTIMIA
jgi:hypothetical protein